MVDYYFFPHDRKEEPPVKLMFAKGTYKQTFTTKKLFFYVKLVSPPKTYTPVLDY